MCSTEPSTSPTMMKSPTSNGLSNMIDREANRSPRMFCVASATATPPMPRLATSVVILIPKLSRIIRVTTTHSNSREMKHSTLLDWRRSPSTGPTLNWSRQARSPVSPHTAACSSSDAMATRVTNRSCLTDRSRNVLPKYRPNTTMNSR